ncbi:hypothetical protein B0T14DRAFT_196076 [Immersiella caudata]|uniref:Uncharacterized protein n=1 Tax=Immersiella caudata TaxID=314043 RepID=A0AA40C4G6_9PEZI|nr:hypothetical protein B0T14DRAFT_196076 [Immersiella caudata]
MASEALTANSIFRVDDMVAAITGGGTGIGLTMARALATNGAAKVYLLGRRLDILQEVAKEHPSIFVPIQCDVTSKESLQAAVDAVTTQSGFVNLVVANSGVGGSPARWDPSLSIAEARQKMFTEHSMEEMTQAFHVNATGAFFTMTAFLELLDAGNKNALKGGFGAPFPGGKEPSVQSQVIFTASVAAFSRHPLSNPSYAGSKAAIMHLTKHSSSAMAPYGIRVNALAPGLFPSDLAAGMIGSRKPDEEGPEDPRFIPVRRFGGDQDMAGTVLYLAGHAGGFCNGTILLMDGGRAAVMPTSY